MNIELTKNEDKIGETGVFFNNVGWLEGRSCCNRATRFKTTGRVHKVVRFLILFIRHFNIFIDDIPSVVAYKLAFYN